MGLKPGAVIRGHYQIIRELGKGGFGVTYLVKDIDKLDKAAPVVIKQIKIPKHNEEGEARENNYLNNLEREAHTLSRLNHDRIPQFLGRFKEENYFYIIQEYIEGHDLRKELGSGTILDEPEAREMLRGILEILDFVHQRQIIHRDIKPGNLIRRKRDRQLILIDFGAVKEIATRHTTSAGTVMTKVIGTPGYMPAEQLSGNPQFNSDIYAVGIIILQAITGLSAQEISELPRDEECNIIWENLTSGISKKFKQIVSKTICYYHPNRYSSVQEILKDLDKLKVNKTFKRRLASTHVIVSPRKIIKEKNKTNRLFYQIRIAIASLSSVYLSWVFYQNWNNINILSIFAPSCSHQLQDNISCGEEILDPQSLGSIRNLGAKYYQKKDYQAALNYFRDSWQKERRDAETLIYLNNTLLETIKADYYTVMIAVPLSSQAGLKVNNSRVGQDFLRGIAQAQTEINLNLLQSNKVTKQTLPGQDFLTARSIDKNNRKGLKIVIVDDGNNQEQAKKAATAIANKPKILGVVGHYTSEMTLATVDIYKQANLAQISFGTTTKELTIYPRSNFFRVVYSNPEEAEAIVNFLAKIDSKEQKVAGFYNPRSEYSNYFWIEIRDMLKQKGIEVVKVFDIAHPQFSPKFALKQIEKLNANTLVLLPDGQVTNSLANAIDVIKNDNGKSMILGANPLANPKIEKIETSQPLKLIAASIWHPLSNSDRQFVKNADQLWENTIHGGSAVAYDAMVALVEAIKLQNNPTRQGTLAQLATPEFSAQGATGEIKFNTPKNGDRLEFMPTMIELVPCNNDDRYYCFLPLKD
ncbi:MAG: bifunctional serine/threonine-protein kinase/ABC transporter substrate-binding protein [Xenococcaceae cyanobacterium MO_188.B29]|nr:bifunctional serine/threonine-protein kinase/ABC transporter substrate-binding protein [Xenococcaceae cyanobacterium MO_188.B29]